MNSLEDIYQDSCQAMKTSLRDRKHPFRIIALATIDFAGFPQLRYVVNREFDETQRMIRFHTDIRSPKIEQLRSQPAVQIATYDPAAKMQLRFSGYAQIHHNDDIALSAWQKSRLFSRKCYLTELSPSSPSLKKTDGIPDKFTGRAPDEEESAPGYDNFTVIRVHYHMLDYLYLDAQGHVRARFEWQEGAAGHDYRASWIIP